MDIMDSGLIFRGEMWIDFVDVAARGLSVNFDRHRKSSKNGGNATSLELAGGREERDTAGPGGSFYETLWSHYSHSGGNSPAIFA
jgi:hypothetical protein